MMSNKKMLLSRKWKIVAVLLAGAMLAAGLTGCGSTSGKGYAEDNYYDGGYAAEAYAEEPMEMAASGNVAYDDYEDAAYAEEESSGSSASSVTMEQKIVVTWTLNLDTENYDDAVSAIREQTSTLGGYIESESESTYSSNQRYDSLVLRIPAEKVQDMIGTIEASGTITSRSQNSDNITLSYVDTQSRLNALRTEQKALEDLMLEAESVEDLITIRSELTNVNYEIESYESQIRAMDNDVDYTAMYVYVDEVKAETEVDGSVGTRIRENFRDSVTGIGNFFQNLFVFVIGYILNIIIWIAVITLIVFAIRKLAKRRRERREQMPEKKPRRKLLRKKNRKAENVEKSEE